MTPSRAIKEPRTPLVDIPSAALQACIKSLDTKFPPAVVTSENQMVDELARFNLMFRAGQRSVVEYMMNELTLRGESRGN